MTRTLPLLILLAAMSLIVAGCESTPKPRDAPPAEPTPTAPAELELDGDALVQTAQLLRDREFEKMPAIVAVDDLIDGELAGCEGRCDEQRRWLTRTLFGGKPPVVPALLALWDASNHQVRWDRTARDPKALRAAVLAELVRGLDRSPGANAPTWDSYLAAMALQHGAGVFVAALDQARERADRLDARALAMRPAALYDLDFGPARFADRFATREGFAFVASLVRAGGWSAVELAHNEPPAGSQFIVRPDRYLAGEQPGQWTLPEEVGASRESGGFRVVSEGVIGPALFVEWLSRHIPAAVARAAYIGFESDHHRVYAHADGRWSFDWVSLWSTPSVAQQVVEALDAGLRTRDDGARFSVLRKGATVAVVGQSGPHDDLAALGTSLVVALPVFAQPHPRGVAFVPTAVDRIQSRPMVTSIQPTAWSDAATGLTLDLAALDDSWTIYPTTEPNLPWFAKHEDGAVLQYLVEPQPLFDPPFAEQAYADLVVQRFASTIVADQPPTAQRSDRPVSSTLVIEARGKIKDRTAEGPVQLRAWHFANAPFVTTLSLQAPPGQFGARTAELTALVDSVHVGEDPGATDAGVIRFRVEE